MPRQSFSEPKLHLSRVQHQHGRTMFFSIGTMFQSKTEEFLKLAYEARPGTYAATDTKQWWVFDAKTGKLQPCTYIQLRGQV